MMGRKCAFCTHRNKHEKYKNHSFKIQRPLAMSHLKSVIKNIKSRYFDFNLEIILIMFVVSSSSEFLFTAANTQSSLVLSRARIPETHNIGPDKPQFTASSPLIKPTPSTKKIGFCVISC
jgi:hypothetical protein